MRSYTPTVIRRSDPARVEIEWSDGAVSVYTPAELRGLCPCAQCVDEISGRRTNDPASVPSDLRQSDLHMIGNYAISMRFSDGHHTGIYTFPYLRENAPEKRDPAGGSPSSEAGRAAPDSGGRASPGAGRPAQG